MSLGIEIALAVLGYVAFVLFLTRSTWGEIRHKPPEPPPLLMLVPTRRVPEEQKVWVERLLDEQRERGPYGLMLPDAGMQLTRRRLRPRLRLRLPSWRHR